MIMNEEHGDINHNFTLKNRKNLNISGVNDVISFDENCVVLETVMGIMSIDGEELKVINLNSESGDIEISGSVNGIIYPQSLSKNGGIFRRKSK